MIPPAIPNKMGVMHEGRLLVSMSVPLMLSMLVTALYNIVDTFFVARIPGIGDAAAGALALAFPVQMLMTALNVGTGAGVGAALSRALGSGDRETVGRTAGNAMLLYAGYYLLMLLFGLLLTKPFIALFTEDATIRHLGVTYLRLVTCFSFGNMGEKCFEKLLQATGKTAYSMIGQLTGSVVNILLDPLFIFGYAGIPAMGVAGAAVATVIAQSCAIAITASLHFCKNTEIPRRLRYLIPRKDILCSIMRIGAPAILMQALTSLMTLGMNFILKGVSAAAVAAYGVYYKLQNFVFMPAFGLNNACVPIIGYNCGSAQYVRVRHTIRYALWLVLTIMAGGVLLFQTLATPIAGIFRLSEDISILCVRALRIISCGFLFAGVNVLLQGVCQALGNGTYSLVISALRLILGVLPPAAVLAALPGAENTVWLVFPCAELLAFVTAILLTRRLYRQVISPTEKGTRDHDPL